MNEIVFVNRKLNIEKLLSFGFQDADGCYVYHSNLVNELMKLIVKIDTEGKLYAAVFDNDSGDEYVLHRLAGASGSFVGQVKTEYEAILDEVAEQCFDPDVFKSEQAKAVIAYVREKYGNELEYLWPKFPDNAVVRRKDNKKWYAALLTVSRRKLDFDYDEKVEILDLKVKPEDIQRLIDGEKYLPGYHMNKKHWVTICLDGTMSTKDIFERIDDSYNLAKR